MEQHLLETCSKIIEPLLEHCRCELYSLKFLTQGGLTLQLMIDHPKGVTPELCEKISREFSVLLDVEDLIPQEYRLEVSSPGIFRELRNEKDYLRFQNERVKAAFWNKSREKILNVRGRLTGFDGQFIRIQKDNGEIFEIPVDRIQNLKLSPVF